MGPARHPPRGRQVAEIFAFEAVSYQLSALSFRPVVSYAHLVRRTVQPERLYNTRIQHTNLVSPEVPEADC
jgi:hypothetical protein